MKRITPVEEKQKQKEKEKPKIEQCSILSNYCCHYVNPEPTNNNNLRGFIIYDNCELYGEIRYSYIKEEGLRSDRIEPKVDKNNLLFVCNYYCHDLAINKNKHIIQDYLIQDNHIIIVINGMSSSIVNEFKPNKTKKYEQKLTTYKDVYIKIGPNCWKRESDGLETFSLFFFILYDCARSRLVNLK